jgi:Ca2+-transporting ATPase
MLFCTFLFYSSAIKAGASIEKARTVAFTTMAFLQIFNTFNCRSFVTSVFRMPFFSNKYVLISVAISSFLTLCTIYLAPFQAIFHTVPLSPGELVLILGASLLVIIGGVEIEKIFRRRFQTSY